MNRALLATLLPGWAAANFIPTCPAPASSKCLLDALELHGAVAVSGVPGLTGARDLAFRALAKCASGDAAPASWFEVELPDKTVRRSLGTRTTRGVPEPLPGGCEGTEETLEPLRAIVDSASRSFLGELEPLVRGSEAVLTTRSGRGYHSLMEMAQGGEQLEHFHVYLPKAAAAVQAPTHPNPTTTALPLHTDAGLFIALVPAMWVGAGSAPGRADGFSVQAADGRALTIDPSAASSSVVFVMGEGWAKWITPRLRSELRAAPHAMAMTPPATAVTNASPSGIDAPPSTMAPSVSKMDPSVSKIDASVSKIDASNLATEGAPLARLWYGRMFLPPSDALMPLRDQVINI